MKTVGEFKKAGLEFVKDDGGEHFLVKNPVSFNGYGASFENDLVRFFSWRENTGVKPEFSGAIDAIIGVGDDSEQIECAPIDGFSWDLDHSYPTVKWRPSLNQPSVSEPDTKQSAEEKRMDIIGQNGNDGLHYGVSVMDDALNAIDAFKSEKSKPIFTQAMADAGELPPVGSKITLIKKSHELAIDAFLGKDVTVIGLSKNSCGKDVITWEHEQYGVCCGIYSAMYFKPVDTRTDREKAIDEMLKDSRCNGSVIEICTERLYDAGYRKC